MQASVKTRAVSSRLGIAARRSDGDFSFTDEQGTSATRVNNDHERIGAFGATQLTQGKTWMRLYVGATAGERGVPGVSEFQELFGGARLRDDHVVAIAAAGGKDVARLRDWSLDLGVRAAAQHRHANYHNPSAFLGGTTFRTDARSPTVATATDATLWGPTSVARVAVDARYDAWRDGVVDADRLSSGMGASWEQRVGRLTVVGAARGDVDSDDNLGALPAVGVAFEFDERWTARANAGRTFRAPNLDELYLDLESVRGDPALNPETAWVGDAGVFTNFGSLRLDAVGFGRAVSREILFLPVSAYQYRAQNIEGTWAAGLELAAALQLGMVRARLNYTFTRAKFRDSAAPVPLQPEHAAFGDASVQWFGFEPWFAGRLRGPIYLDVFGNTRDDATVGLDAGLRWTGGPMRLGVAVRNILDDDAVDAAQQPQPGRTVWATLRFGWDQ